MESGFCISSLLTNLIKKISFLTNQKIGNISVQSTNSSFKSILGANIE